jgi:hypothetical protein
VLTSRELIWVCLEVVAVGHFEWDQCRVSEQLWLSRSG